MIANWLVIAFGAALIIPVGGVGVSDVSAQPEVFAIEVVRVVSIGTVHLFGQQVQALGGSDDVGLLLAASVVVGIGVPVDGFRGADVEVVIDDAENLSVAQAVGHEGKVAVSIVGAHVGVPVGGQSRVVTAVEVDGDSCRGADGAVEIDEFAVAVQIVAGRDGSPVLGVGIVR